MAAQSSKREFKNANNLNAVCEATKQSHKNEVSTSLQPPLQLLTRITSCLKLTGESISLFEGASDEMEASWEVFHLVDDSLDQSDTSRSTLHAKKAKVTSLF